MTLINESRHLNLPVINEPCAFDDIRVVFDGPICYVHFNFYNGAMDKQQADRLDTALQQIDDMPNVEVVALMGGERFFSTGKTFIILHRKSANGQKATFSVLSRSEISFILFSAF